MARNGHLNNQSKNHVLFFFSQILLNYNARLRTNDIMNDDELHF